MLETVAQRYIRLGLQLGRQVDGLVDYYYGPPELAAAADSDPPAEPRTLVSAAEELLDELEDGWLRDQVIGLRTCAGVLAGETWSYPDEVEGCYGIRPTWTDEAVFTAAHERLDELLLGEGSLAERYGRWEESIRVPVDRLRESRWSRRSCCSRARPGRRSPRSRTTVASSSTWSTRSPSGMPSSPAAGRT